MKNLRNQNAPPPEQAIQSHLSTAWDKVLAVYAKLADIEILSDAITGGTLDFLAPADLDSLAELNALILDATFGDFASQAQAEAGVDNTTTMTPLRVAQAIAVLAAGIQNNFVAVTDPLPTDDSSAGYSAGSVWINTASTPAESFRCADPSVGAAEWVKTTLTSDELSTVALTGSSDDLIEGVTKLLMTAAERAKLITIESSATADQSDAEIETAYNNQVAIVPQAEAEAGTSTTVRRWTAERVKQAIAALAGGGGLAWSSANTTQSVAKDTGTVFYALAAGVDADLPTSPAVGDMLEIVNNDDQYNVTVDPGVANELNEVEILSASLALVPGEAAILVCYDIATNKKWHLIRFSAAAAAGGMSPTAVKTANYTATAGEVVLVDSSAGSFPITLPAAPAAQERVIIIDVARACGTYPVTVARNGKTLLDLSEDHVLDQDGARIDVVYDGSANWDGHLDGIPELVHATQDVCLCTLTGTLSLPNGTGTHVDWDVADGSRTDWWDVANPERITVDADGLYQVSGCFEVATGGTPTDGYCSIWLNNITRVAFSRWSPNSPISGGIDRVIRLQAGDYVSLKNAQTSGAGRDYANDATALSVTRIS